MPQDTGRKQRKGKHDPCDDQQRIYQRLTAHRFLPGHNAGELSSLCGVVN
jgi:hypothetical protein